MCTGGGCGGGACGGCGGYGACGGCGGGASAICLGGVFGALVMLELVGNTEAGTRRRSSSTRGRAEEFTKYFHKNMVWLQGIDLANCISCGFLFACDQSRSELCFIDYFIFLTQEMFDSKIKV